MAYFERLDDERFLATDDVQGAWNTAEQHIAPGLGLIGHVIELDHRGRGGALRLSRISYDILGTLRMAEVSLTTRLLRPGRTIELIEATLSQDGRPAVIARAWYLQPADTADLAGSAAQDIGDRGSLPPWAAATRWPGRYVASAEIHRRELEPGRGQVWVRPRLRLLDGEPVSATAHALGIVDIANGMTPRVDPGEVVFPNVDTTTHLLREPQGDWLGFDTTVSFGPDGVGLTHAVLHDERGLLGTSAQALTLRRRPS